MPRLSALQKFDKTLRGEYPSNAQTTERGTPAWAKDDAFGTNAIGAARKALGQDPITFRRPSRDHALAYRVQEIYAVASVFSRSVRQLAGDAAQDSMADIQPYTIVVNESNTTLRKLVYDKLDRAFRRARIGLTTEMRNRRALMTGNAIGQPIFDLTTTPATLIGVKLMPTFEMIRDGKKNTWKQVRDGKTIYEWDIPNFLAVAANDEDDDSLYGTPIASLAMVDYSAMVLALQDLKVAARTRAPRRVVFSIGDPNGGDIGAGKMDEFKKRNAHGPLDIVQNYWVRKNFEEVKSIEGDAAGVKALLEVLQHYQDLMIRAVGLSPRPESATGRGLESIDADYSRRINIVRMNDFSFIKSIGDKVLLLEGMTDVDWSTQIPPLGETEQNRTKRASEELWRGHSSWRRYCATVGIKDPESEQEGISRWFDFCRESGVPLVQGDKEQFGRQDVVGSEAPASGADPQAGRSRRAEQTKSGKTPTGA